MNVDHSLTTQGTAVVVNRRVVGMKQKRGSLHSMQKRCFSITLRLLKKSFLTAGHAQKCGSNSRGM